MGFDYGNGKTNIDAETGMRFGVIPTTDVMWWYEEAEPVYSPTCPHCGAEIDAESDNVCLECGNTFEDDEACPEYPDFWKYIQDGYRCFQSGDDTDVFVEKSPFVTRADFCSPCAPGAVYLLNSSSDGDAWGYCFGYDWFDNENAPYQVFSATTFCPVFPERMDREINASMSQ